MFNIVYCAKAILQFLSSWIYKVGAEIHKKWTSVWEFTRKRVQGYYSNYTSPLISSIIAAINKT